MICDSVSTNGDNDVTATPRQEIKASYATQYLAGRRAFFENKSPAHNPYSLLTGAHAWREGFADAACNAPSLVSSVAQ